ncbi:2-amino-4-hydroxy-6-hydroxymethyldihydropteridine diphosphokinase [Marinivivus vitaminiproducens]|uniref:2-amino-4-hydroxy-6- hydroxymethyldihydropteridine diphosphokinase n=1 Tax=Marinivivus vitaminiproducens TaxID=3035935 RepID=UPI0027A14385|nr:2-amino-4-hydroxy-6-hydroxymethyldihydropteridine diphosphokinase [Geminicoccaceae bacterium SCSIO 64248]
MAEAALGLGSNLGDKAGHLREAVRRIGTLPSVRVVARSSLYRTEPWGPVVQDWFVNACILVETALSPRDLLAAVKAIEGAMGRTPTVRWGPRVIDIDVLYWDDVAMNEASLTLPHPGLFERPFVLVPLCEIAAERTVTGRSLMNARNAQDIAQVHLLHGETL